MMKSVEEAEEIINRSIDWNKNIQDVAISNVQEEKLKNYIRRTYSKIYRTLSKRGFNKWLSFQNLSKSARETVFKICTENEDESLKGNTAGYHRKGNIVFKKGYVTLRVVSHEVYHSLPKKDGWGGFSHFFGEGITDYLAKLTDDGKESTTGYPELLDTIDLYVEMFGEKIIGNYLLNKGENRNFHELLDYIKSRQSVEECNDMNSNFHKFSAFVCSNKNITNETIEKAYETLKNGRNSMFKLFLEYEKKRISQLEYYIDGKVNFEEYNERLFTILKKCNMYGLDKDVLDKGYDVLTEDLIEKSHLLYGLENEERSKVKQEILDKVKRQFQSYKNGENVATIDQNDETFAKLNQKAYLKLSKMMLCKEKISKEDGKIGKIVSKAKNDG